MVKSFQYLCSVQNRCVLVMVEFQIATSTSTKFYANINQWKKGKHVILFLLYCSTFQTQNAFQMLAMKVCLTTLDINIYLIYTQMSTPLFRILVFDTGAIKYWLNMTFSMEQHWNYNLVRWKGVRNVDIPTQALIWRNLSSPQLKHSVALLQVTQLLVHATNI